MNFWDDFFQLKIFAFFKNVDLKPNWKCFIKNRAMALCISLMFGRLGSAAGANVAALLLDNHCESAFYLSGISLIGNEMITHDLITHFNFNRVIFPLSICSGGCVDILHSKYSWETNRNRKNTKQTTSQRIIGAIDEISNKYYGESK